MQSDPDRVDLHQRMIGKIAAMRGSDALDRGALGAAITAEYLAVFQEFSPRILEAGVDDACEKSVGGWRPTPVDVKRACRDILPILARRLLDYTITKANQSLTEAARADYAKWLADLRDHGAQNDPREWGHRKWCAIWGVAYDEFTVAQGKPTRIERDLSTARLLPQWKEYEPQWFERPEERGLPNWRPRLAADDFEPTRDYKTAAVEGWQ